jgi:hypothetical protein
LVRLRRPEEHRSGDAEPDDDHRGDRDPPRMAARVEGRRETADGGPGVTDEPDDGADRRAARGNRG